MRCTASSDETVSLYAYPPAPTSSTHPGAPKPIPPIPHPRAVRALLPLSLTNLGETYLLTAHGDTIRTYDVSTPAEPELLSEVDAHWHDVTALRLWVRKFQDGKDGRTKVEPWLVSASLDGTVRRWRLTGRLFFSKCAWLIVNIILVDLINPPKEPPKPAPKEEEKPLSTLTAEEEAELAELMDDD